MKLKFSLIAVLIFATINTMYSQIIFSNKIDSIKNLVSTSSIMTFDKELSGALPVVVGGNNYTIYSRKYNSPMNPIAAQYIFEKLQGYGLTPRYQNNNATNINVIGKKVGTKYPNKYYIICAHYDNFCPTPPDIVPGADDNASGVCGVLECARLIANMQLDYTVYFIAFDEEEMGLFGSKAYVDSAYVNGDQIMGVLNLDMISYDGNNDSKFKAIVNPQSIDLADDFISANQMYNVGLVPIKTVDGSSGGSDHWYFWQRGYRAFFGIEDDFNLYYHTNNDTYDKINQPYFTKAVKTSVATLLSWALGLKAQLSHTAITSSTDTSYRVAVLKYILPFKVGEGMKSPRLYYKVNHGVYQSVNSFYSSNDTLKFRIPGQLPETKVSYYFALQDSANTICLTLPVGGSGLNPPGTIPPASYFSYYIISSGSQCSNSTPRNIPDLSILNDSILVSTTGKISEVKINLNINHPNDGEILVMLRPPNDNQITLTSYNGTGGSNYTNTTFDDSASVSIVNGTPPFTGSYRPQNSFASFLNTNLNGPWVLRVFDKTMGNQGTLLSWCLLFKYYTPISVNENTIPVSFELKQNYPNPFNPATRIAFSIGKQDLVTLKIYDQLGREIQTLVNDVLTPGDYEAIWNAKNYSSGMYYYMIETNGLSETKRMILTK